MAANRGRKKRKATASFSFPIPPFLSKRADGDEQGEVLPLSWPKYHGRLIGTSVWIDECVQCAGSDSLDGSDRPSDAIYRYGCFGKGSLSRSRPGDVASERKLLSGRRGNISLVTRRHGTELQAQRELCRDRVCLDLCNASDRSLLSTRTEHALEKRVQTLDPQLAVAEEEELASFRERERSPDIVHEDTLITVHPAESDSSAAVPKVFEFCPDDDWGVVPASPRADVEEPMECGNVQQQPLESESCHQPAGGFSTTAQCTAGGSVGGDGVGIVTRHSAAPAPASFTTHLTASVSSIQGRQTSTMLPVDCVSRNEENTAEKSQLIDEDGQEASVASENYHLPFRERLVLSLEEAFFLHFALGCLDVHCDGSRQGGDESILCTAGLWSACCRAQSSFLNRYVVYHYFRAKGWVCRPGLKFGMDFLLYRTSPEFYHSEYGVVISSGDGSSDAAWPPVWSELIRLGRVGESVKKTVILAVVFRPQSVPASDADCFEHLDQFSVQEVVLDWWVPNRTRLS